MKTIIAPVNFTDSSDNAARYAADMALAMETELHLVHFVEIPVSTGEFPMNPYILEQLQKSGTEGLKQLCDELLAFFGDLHCQLTCRRQNENANVLWHARSSM